MPIEDVFESMSIRELEAILAEKKRKKLVPPEMVDEPNYNIILDCVMSINHDTVKNQYYDEDNKHWIYEAVIKALYGDNIDKYFKWVSQFGG